MLCRSCWLLRRWKFHACQVTLTKIQWTRNLFQKSPFQNLHLWSFSFNVREKDKLPFQATWHTGSSICFCRREKTASPTMPKHGIWYLALYWESEPTCSSRDKSSTTSWVRSSPLLRKYRLLSSLNSLCLLRISSIATRCSRGCLHLFCSIKFARVWMSYSHLPKQKT